MTTRNLVLFTVALLGCLVAVAARERTARARVFGEALALIESSALQRTDGDELLDAALDAAVSRLDEHSAFLRGAGRTDLESALGQSVAGIGLDLVIDESAREPVVVTPLPASPAWRAGIVPGDRIEAVDGEPTRGRPLRDVVQRLRGPPGMPVELRVSSAVGGASLDPGAAGGRDVRVLTLVREVVPLETVLGDRRRTDGSWEWLVEGEPGVALVRLEGFGERTAAEFETALRAVAAAGPRGLVIDLRGNPGGLVQAAVDVCDSLLDGGDIVLTRGRRDDATGSADPPPDVRRATAGALVPGLPVVVLVDGLSASAAEIVAACLQDTGRAQVVGERTFGKGTVQSLLPLSDGRGLLKLTTAEYLRPSRSGIHRGPRDDDSASWGVTPDAGCEVTATAEAAERLRAWRRSRDAMPAPGTATVGGGPLPRDVDPALARALELLPGAP